MVAQSACGGADSRKRSACGILLKLGSYGYLRFLIFLFPESLTYFAPFILVFCLISIIFSSMTVLRQLDLKRIIAYSSIAHMNYLMAGLTIKNLLAQTGSLLLQVAHGLSSALCSRFVAFYMIAIKLGIYITTVD